ncbi:MAG: anthranilate phosphoribosyltransferase, partial [Liquorilactobacillus nagelii]
MIKDAIQQVVAGKDLSYQKTAAAINEIMTGQVSDIQIAAFLTALTAKGET